MPFKNNKPHHIIIEGAWKSFFTSLYGKGNYSIFLVNHFVAYRIYSFPIKSRYIIMIQSMSIQGPDKGDLHSFPIEMMWTYHNHWMLDFRELSSQSPQSTFRGSRSSRQCLGESGKMLSEKKGGTVFTLQPLFLIGEPCRDRTDNLLIKSYLKLLSHNFTLSHKHLDFLTISL